MGENFHIISEDDHADDAHEGRQPHEGMLRLMSTREPSMEDVGRGHLHRADAMYFGTDFP